MAEVRTLIDPGELKSEHHERDKGISLEPFLRVTSKNLNFVLPKKDYIIPVMAW